MCSEVLTKDDLRPRLRLAIAWAKRTDWPTRAQDMDEVAQVFDAWEAATAVSPAHPALDRSVLLDALYQAFRPHHGEAAARRLCVLFAVALEPRLRAWEISTGAVVQ